ncbi:MAG: hypothetical protein KBF21_09115 [Thermoanaerobaculia bacterium]|nr:hypothetical protein [Thermoanaerobaculia bacterium]MBP9824367.1 hypothetical protein [Thermoanaerobaculia bacterium]
MKALAIDPLLATLRSAAERGPAAASEALGRLLLGEAAPLLWRTIRSQLGGVPAADQEEVHAAALLRLTERLQQWLSGDPEVEIESFRAYVAATGANGCRAWLRARHPERTRLQNQLRYLLRHDEELALWEGRDGALLCGFAAWRDGSSGGAAASGATSEGTARAGAKSDAPQARDLALSGPARALPLPELVRRLLLWRGGPWGFRDLQKAAADLLDVQDRPPLSLSGESAASAGTEGADPQPGLDLPETRAGAHRELEGRQFLAALWSEVRELPLGQRRALLLNLRDEQGRDRLTLLTLTGLASRADLARLLDLPEPELRELWDELPLDDRTIAQRFDLTARQVINLRKSARARLARRLRPRPSEGASEWEG